MTYTKHGKMSLFLKAMNSLSRSCRTVVLIAVFCLPSALLGEAPPRSVAGVVIYKVRGWGGPSDMALLPFISIERTPSVTKVIDQHGNKKEIFGGSEPLVLFSSTSMEPGAENHIAAIETAMKSYPQFRAALQPMLEGWQSHKAKFDELAKDMQPKAKVPRDVLLADGSRIQGVTVSSVDPDGVKIATESGITKIPFERLHASVQKEFGYDPTAAEEFRMKRQEQAKKPMSAVVRAENAPPADAGNSVAPVSPDNDRGSRGASPAVGESAANTDDFAEGAEIIVGKLPLQLETNKSYVVQGLLLLQNLKNGWLGDLVPEIMAGSFPKQKDETGLLFQTALNEFITNGIYQPGVQPILIVPVNQQALEGVNIPARSTLVSVRGKFSRFHTYETATGASSRAPVFLIETLKLWTGEIVSFSVDQ